MEEFTRDDVSIIEQKILKIETERGSLVLKKKELEQKMMEIKCEIKTKILHHDEYTSLKEAQVKTRNKILKIESNIKEKKDELRRLQIMKEDTKHLMKPSFDFQDLLNSIQSLKNKYSDFSLDRTRIPSMRKMTTEFVKELSDLISHVESLKNNNIT